MKILEEKWHDVDLAVVGMGAPPGIQKNNGR